MSKRFFKSQTADGSWIHVRCDHTFFETNCCIEAWLSQSNDPNNNARENAQKFNLQVWWGGTGMPDEKSANSSNNPGPICRWPASNNGHHFKAQTFSPDGVLDGWDTGPTS